MTFPEIAAMSILAIVLLIAVFDGMGLRSNRRKRDPFRMR